VSDQTNTRRKVPGIAPGHGVAKSCLSSDENKQFRSLLRRVRRGSEEAAWDLIQQYGEAIRRGVRRVLNKRMRSKFDSMDFVQVVWLSLFRAKDRLDRFQRPEELAAYILQMARNKVGLEVRRRLMTEKYNINREMRLPDRHVTTTPEPVDPAPLPDDIAIARERWDRLIEGQPERSRRIIKLRLLGRINREIAEELGIAEVTVRRFLKKLSDDQLP